MDKCKILRLDGKFPWARGEDGHWLNLNAFYKIRVEINVIKDGYLIVGYLQPTDGNYSRETVVLSSARFVTEQEAQDYLDELLGQLSLFKGNHK